MITQSIISNETDKYKNQQKKDVFLLYLHIYMPRVLAADPWIPNMYQFSQYTF